MSDYELPSVNLTPEELTYLQDHLNAERSQWFNYYEDCLANGRLNGAEVAHKHYETMKSLRDKIYHMNGRDTLAPGNHEQRWWDQRHDY